MKRILAITLALGLLLGLCACGGGSSSQTDEGVKTVRIGVFEPQTGTLAQSGKKETLGIEYAHSLAPTVTVGRETYQVELVYADSASAADGAAGAAQALADQGVSLVIGSYGTDLSLVGGPVFEAAGIPVIGASCTGPGITLDNDYYFRICYQDGFQAQVLCAFARNQLGSWKAYCLGQEGSSYDQELLGLFCEAFREAGGTAVSESFPAGCTDFTPYLERAAAEGADVLFLPVSTVNGVRILSQAAAYSLPVLGPDTLDDDSVLAAVRDTGLRLYVSTFYQEGGSDAFDTGLKEYMAAEESARALNGGSESVSAVTAMGYDAYNLALEAIRAAGSVDKADILAALPAVSCKGVAGHIAFDEDGSALRESAYIKSADTEDGVWVLKTVQKISSR